MSAVNPQNTQNSPDSHSQNLDIKPVHYGQFDENLEKFNEQDLKKLDALFKAIHKDAHAYFDAGYFWWGATQKNPFFRAKREVIIDKEKYLHLSGTEKADFDKLYKKYNGKPLSNVKIFLQGYPDLEDPIEKMVAQDILASEYKIHIMPKPEYILGFVEKFLEACKNDNGTPSLKDLIHAIKILVKPDAKDELGNPMPYIVIACAPGYDNANLLLNKLFSLFSKYSAFIGSGQTPRYNAKVDSLFFWCQGGGDFKNVWKQYFSEQIDSLLVSDGSRFVWGKALSVCQGYDTKTRVEMDMPSKETLSHSPKAFFRQIRISSKTAIFIPDFARNKRTDIAYLLESLNDPNKHKTTFETVKKEYEQSNDYPYGFVLAFCYEYGYGTTINREASFAIHYSWHLKHPLASAKVANEYLLGEKNDPKKAIELFQSATASNQTSFYVPHFLWGKYLLRGIEVKKNEEKALELLKLAAQNGIGMAAYELAAHFARKTLNLPYSGLQQTYLSSPRCTSDMKSAMDQLFLYAEKASVAQIIEANIFLAVCHALGYGTARNERRALELITLAFNVDYSEGSQGYAMLRQHKWHNNFISNPEHAIRIFLECNQMGLHIDFLSFLDFYQSKKDNPEFMKLAYQFCQECLKGYLAGNPLDSTLMGHLYSEGILVPRNIAQAIMCWRQAAECGDLEAARSLVLFSGSQQADDLQTLYRPTLPEVSKYFPALCDDDYNVAAVNHDYRTRYLPLYKTLNEVFTQTPSVHMPVGLIQIMTDYAHTALKM